MVKIYKCNQTKVFGPYTHCSNRTDYYLFEKDEMTELFVQNPHIYKWRHLTEVTHYKFEIISKDQFFKEVENKNYFIWIPDRFPNGKINMQFLEWCHCWEYLEQKGL